MSFKKLRVGRYGGVDVVEYRECTSGVLSGQTLCHFIDNYPDEGAALAAHPDASGYTSKHTAPRVNLSHLPGEDDPVPGGMYPDDYTD